MRIEIVQDIKEKVKADNIYASGIIGGKATEKKKGERTLIVTPEIFAKIFSPERIRLIQMIKKHEYHSLYQLADESGRKYEAVHRDIKLLEGYGLIKTKIKDRRRIPYIDESISPVIA